jgi:hypothetical protein
MNEMVDRDLEHLRLLKFAYYILAGISGVGTLFAALWIVMMAAMFTMMPAGPKAPPPIVGFLFLGFGVLIVTIGVSVTLLTFYTGRNLAQHRHHMFCIVVAALTCLSVPWGTAVGVCTIIVLNRPGVKALFETGPPSLPLTRF